MDDSVVLSFLKVTVMLVFFFIVIFCGTLPLRSQKFKQSPLLKAIGGTFAGCLFVNVALLHILPQASDTLQHFLRGESSQQQQQVFPLANLLMMIGFIITVFFTKVLFFHSHQDDHSHQHTLQVQSSDDKQMQQQLQKQDKNRNQIREGLMIKVTGKEEVEQFEEKNKSLLNQAFILTLAMYFHTIFEGLAIGVQDSITGFLSTAVAIAFHKWADALSMGLHYKSKNVKKSTSYILIVVQAILNVIAIGIGWSISSLGEVAQAIFLSISAGTFLAISTMETLGQQLHHKQYMGIKFGLLIGATLFVSGIWFVENSLFN